jgi:hypothetical protein
MSDYDYYYVYKDYEDKSPKCPICSQKLHEHIVTKWLLFIPYQTYAWSCKLGHYQEPSDRTVYEEEGIDWEY